MDATFKVVCLIASHINCNERLIHFRQLLRSINKQRNTIDKNIIISLSYDTDIQIDSTIKLIEKYRFQLLNNKTTKLSQFEHYNNIVVNAEISDPDNTWIIFSDDDDIWSDDRLHMYNILIPNVHSNKIVTVIKTPSYQLTNSEIKKMTGNGNYVDRCVRYTYVKFFFENINLKSLKNKFCDMFFSSLISRYGDGKLMVMDIDLESPIYIWRHVDYPRNCKSSDRYIMNNLDLYMAYISIYEHNCDQFIEFYKKYKLVESDIPDLVDHYERNHDRSPFFIAKKIFLNAKYVY